MDHNNKITLFSSDETECRQKILQDLFSILNRYAETSGDCSRLAYSLWDNGLEVVDFKEPHIPDAYDRQQKRTFQVYDQLIDFLSARSSPESEDQTDINAMFLDDVFGWCLDHQKEIIADDRLGDLTGLPSRFGAILETYIKAGLADCLPRTALASAFIQAAFMAYRLEGDHVGFRAFASVSKKHLIEMKELMQRQKAELDFVIDSEIEQWKASKGEKDNSALKKVAN